MTDGWSDLWPEQSDALYQRSYGFQHLFNTNTEWDGFAAEIRAAVDAGKLPRQWRFRDLAAWLGLDLSSESTECGAPTPLGPCSRPVISGDTCWTHVREKGRAGGRTTAA